MTLVEFKTKTELAQKLNMSLRTLQRRLVAADLEIPRGLISPELQKEILKKLNKKNLDE
jgi:ATP sulfurylase